MSDWFAQCGLLQQWLYAKPVEHKSKSNFGGQILSHSLYGHTHLLKRQLGFGYTVVRMVAVENHCYLKSYALFFFFSVVGTICCHCLQFDVLRSSKLPPSGPLNVEPWTLSRRDPRDDDGDDVYRGWWIHLASFTHQCAPSGCECDVSEWGSQATISSA